MILQNDFSDFHGVSPIQASTKRMNYKFKSDYISNYQLLREQLASIQIRRDR